jgi:putative endopeptidase
MIHKTALFGASLAALALATPALANDDAHAHDAGIELLLAEGEAAAPALPTMSFGSWGFDPALLATDI